MFQLGEKIYDGAIGFETFDQSKESAYAEHALIGAKPATQRVGDLLDTVSVSIRLHNAVCIPEDEIATIEEERKVGYILALFSRGGQYFGDFLITSYRVRVEQGNSDGTILLASVTIELKEYYYQDRAAAKRRAAQIVGFASAFVAIPFPEVPIPDSQKVPGSDTLPDGTPAPVQTVTTAAPVTLTRDRQTFQRVTQMAGTVARIGTAVRGAAVNPAQRTYYLRDAARQAGALTNQYASLTAYLNGTGSPGTATANFLYSLSGGSGASSANLPGLAILLRGQAVGGDYAGAASTLSDMESEQTRITKAAMPFVTSAAVGRSIL